MQTLSLSRRVVVVVTLAVLATVRVGAQDSQPDRFGVGVTGLAGWFGHYSAVFLGAEGFVRVVRGSFWSARVDGAYFSGRTPGDIVCLTSGGNGGCDTRYLGKLGTLIATLVLGPTATNGLRPFYGLLGVGGAVTRWGGGDYFPPQNSSASSVSGASGAGPSFALMEAGLGSEFRALGGNRIELRIHRVSPPPPSGNRALLGAVGASLTIGVVW